MPRGGQRPWPLLAYHCRMSCPDSASAPRRPWFLYLLECSDGSYYAGISTDVEARFRAHLAGKGARYTRAHPPLRILAFRVFADRAAASRAEWQLKQQPRARKQAWLEHHGQ